MTVNTHSMHSETTSQSTSRRAQTRRTLSNALIITRREVRDSFRDWRIIAPIILLTFFFPILAQFIATKFENFVSQYGAELIGERTIPFLLMVVGFFPISISLVIALETFVGEKERRSLEPLLSTPLSNTELYIGKTLSSMIPPLIASYGGMTVYLISLVFGETAWRPPAMLVIQIFLLTAVQALVMVTGAVVVSSQTTSTRAANLLASFIIIPMTLLVQGESIIMFMAPDADSPRGVMSMWFIIGGMIIVTALLLRVGNSIFNREELLGSTIDQANLRGTLRKIRRQIRAVDASETPAGNLIDWYRRGIPIALRQVRTAMFITTGVFIFAFSVGVVFSQQERWQIPTPTQAELAGSTELVEDFLSDFNQSNTMMFIFWQNSRVLLLTFVASLFTFGVVALIIPPVTFALLGYIIGLLIHNSYSISFIVSIIFTHGVIEIPIILLATSASLALGAAITRPPQGETVGHAWIVRLSGTLKLAIGVIIPGLIIAAFIEAFITPYVALFALGS
jgi:uncharacterized membrane protein SpoIIM required for sporulation/ABC-type transport system involved in multi-copper enzyme maturation permease subunit